MPFTPRDWKDAPDSSTPLSAAALKDQEARLAAYADSVFVGAQPADSDLSAIAALSTTAFGRSLLTQADAAAVRTLIGAGTGGSGVTTAELNAAVATLQPLDSDLTAVAALATTTYGRAFLALADAAAARTALGLGTAATQASTAFDSAGAATAAQAASQPVDSDLTAIASLTTTAYGRAFLALVDAAAGRTALGLGTAVTAALDTDTTLAADSDTRVASQKAVKAYVTAHAGGGGSAAVIPRRAATYGSQRGRTLAARFGDQNLMASQFDLVNMEYTTASDSRAGVKPTDWLTPASIIAKSQYQFEDSETHLRLEIPAGGVHSSNEIRLHNRYVNSAHSAFGSKNFNAGNPVINVNETINGVGTYRQISQATISDGFWHIVYANVGPVHFFKSWPESGLEPDWQIVVVKSDLSPGWTELGVMAFTAQYADQIVITDLTTTEILRPADEIGWNGDFSITDTGGSGSGLPIGWAIKVPGGSSSTTFADVTIDGVARKAAVLTRSAEDGGEVGLTVNLYPRTAYGTPRFPATIPRWARYLEVGLTHKMENIAHSGVASFLGAAVSVYYNDIKSGGLNTIGGGGGGAQPDYYAGWGPAGAVGGSGSAGGLGSTGGFVRETRCIPIRPNQRADLVAPTLTLHDSDVTGTWTIADVTMRLIA